MRFLKLIYLLTLFTFTSYISAQNYVVEKFTNANELDSNEILKIHLDKHGNLWVATRFGVMIKDMERFNLVKRFNEQKFNNVWDIIEDQNNDLWFASYGRGIIFFDGQKVFRYSQNDGLISDRFRKLKLFKNKIYAAGIHGISIIDVKTNKIQSFTVQVPKNELFECSAFMEMGGKLYVASISHGVYEITPKGLKLINPYRRILTAYTYSEKLFLSSNDGVTVFNQTDFLSGKKIFKHSKLPIIWDYEYMGDGQYWMATYDIISSDGGILAYNSKNKAKPTYITKDLKINANQPNDIVYDRENSVAYISTLDNGLYRLLLDMPIRFEDLKGNAVIDLFSFSGNEYLLTKENLQINHEGNISTLTSRDEFWNYFQKHKYVVHPNSLNEQHFFQIDFNQSQEAMKLDRLVMHNNKIWVGSNIGLFEVNLQGKIESYYPIHTYNFAFLDNKLIDAHPFGGIKIFDDLKRFKYTYYSESLENIPSAVVSISHNSKAVFFGSSLDGLFKYENGKFVSYNKLKIFKERKIKHVKCYGENELLVATEFGDVYLFEIRGNLLRLKKKIDSTVLESSNISFINKIQDKIIIGTFLGLIINDGNKNYLLDEEQGLKYKSVSNSSQNGSNILIGVDNGYYAVDIHQFIQQKVTKPKVLITGLKVNNEKFGREKFKWFDLIDRNLSLPYSENNIYIDFALVNPKFPSKYKYRYRLNEKEKWSAYFTDEFIHFNSLKNGKYNIELEVTDLNTSTVTIHPLIYAKIYPPFYLHPLFIFSQLVLIALVLYRFYVIKINNINEINALKIKQIEDMKDSENERILLEKKMSEVRLMALQSQMNPHFIFNILNSIQYYIIDNDLENALESLSNFATLIRKMLDMSSMQAVTLKEEIKFLKLYVSIENYRYKNKIAFEVDVDPIIDIKAIKIPPMMLQPLVENAFVHAFQPDSTSNKIKLKIHVEGIYLVIEVIDNGIGLDFSNKKGKFHKSKGVKIIKERLHIFNNKEGEFLKFFPNNPGTCAVLYLCLLRIQDLD